MTLRIRQARERAGLSQKALAKRLGISAATLSGYESGSHEPRLETVANIARACDVSADCLLGLGERGTVVSLSDEASELAADYAALDEYGQMAVRAVLEAEKRRVAAAARPLTDDAHTRSARDVDSAAPRMSLAAPEPEITLRYYESPAAAGSPNDADSSFILRNYPARLVPPRTLYAVGINGASMEPDIPDGSTVFVGAADYLSDGDVLIAWIEGEGAVCKRVCLYGQSVTRLMSANRACPDIEGQSLSGLRVLGKVQGLYGASFAPRRPDDLPPRMTDREKGEAMRQRRIAMGFNLTDAAAVVGATVQALGRWESGAEPIPSHPLRALCGAYGLDERIFK